MRLDEMACRQGTTEGKLSSENGGTDDAGETAGVVAGVGGVRALDAEHVKHGTLGFEDGAAAEGTDFEGWHRYGDL